MSRRMTRLLLALVVALAAVGVITVASQSRPGRLAADFTIDYSAGLLVREGRLAAPYQQGELARTMRAVAPDGGIDPRLPYNKPLAEALPFALLTVLPIEVAFRVWQLISLGLLAGAMLLLQRAFPLGREAPMLAALGLLAAVPTWATLTEGQPTSLVLVGAALVILSTRAPNVAIAALGGALLAVKPQYLPAYLAILLATRHWRLLAASLAGGAVVLLSPLAGGPDALIAMLHNALSANHAVNIRLDESWVGILGGLMPPGIATAIALSLDAAAVLALGWIAWRRPSNLTAYFTVAGLLAVLVSPHALPHDLLLLAVPAWLTFSLWREGPLPNVFAVWVVIDLAMVLDLHGFLLPATPAVITMALVGGVWWWLRRRDESRRLPMAHAG